MADRHSPFHFLWHPAVAYLIAAAAILALIFWPKPKPDVRTVRETVPFPAAIIAAVLPDDLEKENPLAYSSPTDQIYLFLKAAVKPKRDHRYDLYLTKGLNDSTVIELFEQGEYDSVGNAIFTTQTDTGQFKFSIHDIIGTDTTVTTWPFRVILERE